MLCFAALAVASTSVVGCSLPRGVTGLGSDVGILDAEHLGADASTDAAVNSDDSGLEAGPDVGASECSVPSSRCSSDQGAVETCATGSWVPGPICPLGCLTSGGAHCATFDVDNVATSTVSGGADIVVDAPITIITDGCTGLPGVTGATVAQDGGGPMICLFDVGSFTVTTSGSVVVTGAYPLVIVAQGAVEVSGMIDASSYTNGTPRIGAGASRSGHVGGDGSTGAGYDAGGGGGGFGGNGGDGANAAAGSVGGAGGLALPSTLMPLIGGAGGGSGSGGSAPNGGAGGGAIQITSFVSVNIAGTLAAAGAGGGGGGDGGRAAGGGGGSGGGILVQAPIVTLASSTTAAAVTVAGGGGGGGGCNPVDGHPGTDGAAAGLGRAPGGVSCAGISDGGAGGGSTSADGTTPGNGGGFNAPGGGGGVGRVVFHTASGALPSGATNPSSGTPISHLPLTLH